MLNTTNTTVFSLFALYCFNQYFYSLMKSVHSISKEGTTFYV